MQTVSIAVLACFIILILSTKPKNWIIIFVAAIAYYPNFLTIPLGTVDFNVSRILCIFTIALLLSKKEYLNNFKLCLLDKFVILGICSQFIAYCFTTELSVLIENRAGALLDTVIPYFIVRILLKDWETYLRTIKFVIILIAPLAILGVYQSVTGNNPVGFLFKYHGWGLGNISQDPRWGLHRANVTFPMSIMFGLFFAVFTALCTGILKTKEKNQAHYLFLGISSLGILSSMSSGPWMSAMLSILFILFYKYRKYWKPLLVVFAIGCLAVEFISNRHFYDVLTRFTFSSSTAWYRTRLFEVAFFEGGMAGHWIFGYGAADPGWGLKIDYRNFTDMVNHYLLILSRYGLVGFIPFMAIIIESIREIIKAFKNCFAENQKWLVWCLAASMFGLYNTMNTVSLFGPPGTVLYILFALTASVRSIQTKEKKEYLKKIYILKQAENIK